MACVVVNGNPWFRGKDIATLLDYADTKKAIAKNVSEDDRSYLEELMGDRESPIGYRATNVSEDDQKKMEDLMGVQETPIGYRDRIAIYISMNQVSIV